MSLKVEFSVPLNSYPAVYQTHLKSLSKVQEIMTNISQLQAHQNDLEKRVFSDLTRFVIEFLTGSVAGIFSVVLAAGTGSIFLCMTAMLVSGLTLYYFADNGADIDRERFATIREIDFGYDELNQQLENISENMQAVIDLKDQLSAKIENASGEDLRNLERQIAAIDNLINQFKQKQKLSSYNFQYLFKPAKAIA